MEQSLPLKQRNRSFVNEKHASSQAFAAIYDSYFARVYNYMRYRVHDAPTADDLTAKVFENALKGFAGYQSDKAPVGGWLFGIARNVVADHFRRGHDSAELDGAAEHHSTDLLPEEQVAHREDQIRLLDAVARMDDRERHLIALKFSGRLSHREIAEILEISESNVAVTLYRTLRRLRGVLEEENTK